MDKRILELLVKKKLGTLSLSEHTELGSLISDKELVEKSSEIIDEFWESSFTYENDQIDLDKHLSKVNLKIDALDNVENEKPFKWKQIFFIAASLIFMIGFSTIYWYNKPTEVEQQNTVVTKKGSKSMVILPDGSKVWINNDSKIIYSKSFGKNLRELSLVGEAYFDVVKDPSKPFIVHTAVADVRVLGTVFNVKAYPEDVNVETTLLNGVVELDIKGDNNQVIRLKPNEKVIIKTSNEKLISHSKKIDTPKIVLENVRKSFQDSTIILETQWVENKLVFEQEKLSLIILMLERWYDVKINVNDNVLDFMDKRISGTFQDDSIADVLKSILNVVSLKYTIKNKTISIHK